MFFGPATPPTHHSFHQYSSLHSVHHCLSLSHSPATDTSPHHAKQQMVQHLINDSFLYVTCKEEEEEEEEEHFPTAPLDDNVWMDEPVLDRHLCIYEHSQPHDLHLILAHTAWISYTSLQNMH